MPTDLMPADLMRAEELRVRYLTEAIETATPAGRLTMLYDALEMDLARADRAMTDGSPLKVVSDWLIHAQEIILTLRDTLDTKTWEGAARLIALYDYLHVELVKANLEKNRDRVVEVAGHVSQLGAAWRAAAAKVDA